MKIAELLRQEAAGTDGTLLRDLFLQRLPANVRTVLASSEETTTLEELAVLGDKIITAASPAVAPSQQPCEIRAKLVQLQEMVRC